MSASESNWSLVTHLDHGENGTLTLVRPEGETTFQKDLTSPSPSGKQYVPWFLGMLDDDRLVLFDPEHKTISLEETMPTDAYPAYSYKDPNSDRIWFMNDGDKETGNDPLNCGDQGSTVTIIDRSSAANPKHLATLCVGRGHHVTTFVAPTSNHPNNPKVAFVSNLLDGTITIVNNDETDKDHFLSIIDLIDLTEPEKEKEPISAAPNNAFPHGKQYSDVTGKIYSLNNGYGTVAVIDPVSFKIESRINLKGSSNLLLSPCGKYIIGKGADRKSNPEHVIGKISVVDLEKQAVVTAMDVEDFYPSVYRFSPDGKKLYVTSAATGKGKQKENLQTNIVNVYDATQLPQLPLLETITVGDADCGRRPLAFTLRSASPVVFIPNPTEGTLSLIDNESLQVIDTIKIAINGGKEFNFSLWEDSIYGA